MLNIPHTNALPLVSPVNYHILPDLISTREWMTALFISEVYSESLRLHRRVLIVTKRIGFVYRMFQLGCTCRMEDG